MRDRVRPCIDAPRRAIMRGMNVLRCACIVVTLASLAAAPLSPDEVAPPTTLPCFPGAIYRKAVSSTDRWTGIEATVTLPEFTADPARVGPNGRPLDNASIYLGGRAGATEIDCGVSWEVIREPDGSVSKERKAFRPFWRNKQWVSGPAKPGLYFYPGDTIWMSCESSAEGKLTFRVKLVKRADGTPAIASTDAEHPYYSRHDVTFDAPGFGPGKPQQFKRVNAIDQVGNEGKSVALTKASTNGTRWEQVVLLRGDNRRPMIAERFTDMRCPDAKHVVVTADAGGDQSGERVDLVGAPAK